MSSAFAVCGDIVVGRINEVTLRRARPALGWVTRLRAGMPSGYATSKVS